MVKFGIFSDLHVDIMHDTQRRVELFLEGCRENDVDFIIQLGDFCYPEDNPVVKCKPEHMPENIANALIHKSLADKRAIVRLYNDFEKPSYHVLGNHECDMCSKQELLDFIEAKNGSYYSFDSNGFHFVVLDTNYVRMANGEFFAYENGNYFECGFRDDWEREWVSSEQLVWLEEDLKKTDKPTVVFSHAGFGLTRSPILSAKNSVEIRKILKSAPNGVLACFNGHQHIDSADKEDGIWYVNINSMGSAWVGKKFTCENRYGKEIDEKYPNVKYTVPYKEPVYAIVEIDEDGIRINGTQSEFVGPSPEALGVYAKGGSWEEEYGLGKTFITASQENRYLEFDKK